MQQLEGEQMCLRLEMTDCTFVCRNQRTCATLWLSDHRTLPRAGQAEHMPSGLTKKSWFTLGYGSASVCKVEKNLRKTKVYEWLNSPVAC